MKKRKEKIYKEHWSLQKKCIFECISFGKWKICKIYQRHAALRMVKSQKNHTVQDNDLRYVKLAYNTKGL